MIAGTRVVPLAIVLLALVSPRAVRAQQVVTVTVPPGVSFNVVDVAASTSGTPNATQVTYDTPTGFSTNEKLRIFVQADSNTFVGPDSAIPASKVSWTATAAAGNPSNGTLAFGTYKQVYVSPNRLKPTSSGSVTLAWSLASIAAAGLRSGTHTLTIRWKFEVF